MYILFDTFNGLVVSRHRTIKGAVKSDIRLQNRVSRNSRGSYLPTEIRELTPRGARNLDPDSPELEQFLFHPLRG
jgi:hypothetical protein